ncbi:MAG: 8-amino-7-oxononanoate synthase [Desulfobacterales bacterium]|nr:8-amino-7-oxononanoate synthase [Desulfobacterales bacterium]
MSAKWAFLEAALAARRERMQMRRLETVEGGDGAAIEVGGRRMLNFCSNDYLGLSRHPLLQQRAADYLARYGTGSGSSRLICGNHAYFGPVEERLAALKGTEAALVFNSGFQANATILPALADRETLILSDRLNHNSLIQGARLARCRVEIFAHNDMAHLRALLDRHRPSFRRILIVTESVFSMDGDLCPLAELAALARAFGAILVVDEAHATGVIGPKGMGLSCGHGVDVTIGTFSKACGGFGAYVAGSRQLRDYLINCCAGIIYSTALPPAVLGAVDGALELVPGMEAERRRLHAHADLLRTALRRMGWDCGPSSTQIVPVMVGSEGETLALSQWLGAHGIYASAIRPPTVEKEKSRIRLAVTAMHTTEDIERVIEAFGQWKN